MSFTYAHVLCKAQVNLTLKLITSIPSLIAVKCVTSWIYKSDVLLQIYVKTLGLCADSPLRGTTSQKEGHP